MWAVRAKLSLQLRFSPEKMWSSKSLAVLALLCLASGVAVASIPDAWIRATDRLRAQHIADFGPPEHHMVEMRDGVKLSTVVYIPRNNESAVLPVVMDRSPYGHFATELLALIFARFGFVAVMQDVRGARRSEGKYEFWRTDGEDTSDTIDWLSEQPWCDQQVFQIGFSADGNAALAGGRFTPELLKGQWIGWATGDGHGTAFQGGVWVENLLEGWLTRTGFPEMVEEVLENEEYTPEWWGPIDIDANGDICRWPSAHWAGWYDIFQAQTIEAWEWYQSSVSGCPDRATLFIDPHGHCGMMDVGDTVYPLSRLPLPIFQAIDLFVAESGNAFGREKLNALYQPEDADALTFYVMGAGEESTHANYWTTLPAFPTPTIESWFLHADGSLARNASSSADASVSFVYDPKNPVESNGGNNLLIDCGQFDQRANEGRDDVLVFTSAALTEPYAITGRMYGKLFVETSANDTDFTVMINDVYPDGRSLNIADGIVRLLWRERYALLIDIECLC